MSLLSKLVIAACAFALPAFAGSSQQPIETFSLKNGMEVIVLPNHRVPAVNHMLWYRAGSADDPPGKSGLAHYLEHLMFKGSPKYKDGEYVAIVNRNGGEQNAFTTRDTTSYYVTVEKERLPLIMELEADRMRAITVGEEQAKREQQVIIEERRQRTDNSPAAQLSEQMDATLFLNHPYRLPPIGWLHEMLGLTLDDARAFHAKYYHPNNAVLIVSGDITAAELRPLAEKYYGDLPRKDTPVRHWLSEPPHVAARSVTLKHQHVKQPSFTRSYLAPSVAHGDKGAAFPTFVLSYLLGGGKNSVLYRSLVVEQKIAADIDSSYQMFALGPSELSLEIVPEAGVPLSKIEAALDAELAKFLKTGADETSLARAKKLMNAEAIYAREGLTGISNIMGWIVMSGLPPEEFNRWGEHIDAVTAGQVLAAARSVLVPEASVSGYLLPGEEAQ